jgi:acyl-CoA thioesterase
MVLFTAHDTPRAMPSLTELITPRGDGAGFRIDVPDGWQQGRGAFGGLVLGALTRAMTAVVADPHARLRSLAAELPAPTEPGDAAISVEVLRRGSAVSTLAARLVQADVVRAHAVGVFGKPRGDSPVRWQTEAPPVVAPWTEVAPIAIPGGSIAPPFSRFFEYRPLGPAPYSRASEARCAGWIRARDPGLARDDAYVVAMADAYWPAALAVLAAPRPMATVSFTLELIDVVDDLDPDAPLYHRAYAPAAADGYTFETRELWGSDGRLVARNHQVFVVIK